MAKATGIEVARISVKVSPDTKQFRSDLKKELTEIERTLKGDIEVNAHLDPAQAKADFKRFMAQLKAEGAKGVKVNSRVVQSGSGGPGGGGRKGSGGEDEADEISKLGALWKKITSKLEAPNFGSGINFTGYLVIATAIASIAAPLAGLITGLVMSLPGLLALVLTPIAAITIGLDGIKAAAQGLVADFNGLKEVMSQATQQQFSGPFEKLREIFPTLRETLPAVSQGMADILSSIVGVVTGGKGMGQISAIITNIGGALSAAAPGFGHLTSAILTLTENFSGGALNGLIEWFNGAMKSFDDFMTKLDESGDLDTIFASVGASLKVIVDGLGAIAAIGLDFLTDPEAMLAFMAILKGTVALLVGVFAASKGFLNAVGVAAIWVADTLVRITSYATTLFASVMEFAGRISSAFMGAFTNFLQVAGEVWGRIKEIVANAINAVKTVVSDLGSDIAGAWNTIYESVANVMRGVSEAFTSGWAAAKEAVQNGIQAVIDFMTALPGQIVSALGDLGGILLGAGRAVMEGFLNGLTAGFNAVKDFVGGIAGWIADHKGPIDYDKTVLVPHGEAFMQGLGKGLENGFQPVLDQASGMADRIAAAFADGTDPTQFLKGLSKQDINRMEKALGIEMKNLERQAKALDLQASRAGEGPLADSLRDRAKDLRLRKSQLSAEKEMIDLTQDYAGLDGDSSGGDDPFVKAASGLMNSPVDFAKATGKQFLSDLGIGGDGAIGNAITEGISYIFNIGSVDEAMSIKDRQDSANLLSVVGR